MAMHTRYPGHSGHQPQPGSPLGRVVEIIDQVPLPSMRHAPSALLILDVTLFTAQDVVLKSQSLTAYDSQCK